MNTTMNTAKTTAALKWERNQTFGWYTARTPEATYEINKIMTSNWNAECRTRDGRQTVHLPNTADGRRVYCGTLAQYKAACEQHYAAMCSNSQSI